MKPAIFMGLTLLLASCAAPQHRNGTHARVTDRRPQDTLRPRLVTLRDTPGHPIRNWRPGEALPGDLRTYGMVEMPAPIASREAPHASSYQAPVPPRRVINQITNGTAPSNEAPVLPSADVTPSGSYRSVINQITNQPLPDGEPTRAPHGSNETVISAVTNAPVATSPAPIVPPKPHTQRTVIDPIANSPVQ